MNTKGILVVDMQNDFCNPNGALYVKDAELLAPDVDAVVQEAGLIVSTLDWHRADDESFKAWPPHCIRGSWGAELFDDLPNVQLLTNMFLRKNGYSAFRNANGKDTGLNGYLRDNWVSQLMIVGVALDFCVLESARDAVGLGFDVTIPLELTAPVFPKKFDDTVKMLESIGVKVM